MEKKNREDTRIAADKQKESKLMPEIPRNLKAFPRRDYQ
jgi:hypothetical protein